ncbi:hypothetical protein P9112_007532 [Eukaryota sp. TZLM1-RC]
MLDLVFGSKPFQILCYHSKPATVLNLNLNTPNWNSSKIMHVIICDLSMINNHESTIKHLKVRLIGTRSRIYKLQMLKQW